MSGLFTGMLLILAGAVSAALAGQKYKGWLLLGGTALAQIFILPVVVGILLSGQTASLAVTFSLPIGEVQFAADPLSAFFLLIISLGGLLALIYSIGYMKMYLNRPQYSPGGYYFFVGLLIAAMMLVTLVQNALLFLIVWEIMSLTSFFLVSFENGKEEVRQAALYYFTAMQVGAAFLITGFGWASLLSGDMSFASFGDLVNSDKTAATIIFVLLFIGFGTKAGFIPMHTWLPLAHPAAPSGVSAMMSGIMIKTGIYGILRVIFSIGIPASWLAWLVFGIGLFTGVLGIMNAAGQRDLKKLLAYSSIENIGIIGMGIGLGMIGSISGNPFMSVTGYFGALLHVFNHFTFKSLLFYGAGAVYSQTHTRDIERLGGLMQDMPYTSALFLLASMAISGLPLFNGFVSEFAIYIGLTSGVINGDLLISLTALFGLGGLALIGITAVICFTKVFGIVFQGVSRSQWEHRPSEVSTLFLVPMFAMAALILLIGLAAPLVLPLFRSIMLSFGAEPQAFTTLEHIYLQLSQALWILGGLILFFTAVRWLLLHNRPVTLFKTWDCGYQIASPRFQYTAASFASSFLGLVSEAVPLSKYLEKPGGLFPESAGFHSHSDELLDRFLIRPLLNILQHFLQLFSWIQSGRTQQYILYGLVFLIILIVWIIGVR